MVLDMQKQVRCVGRDTVALQQPILATFGLFF